jgi:predicted DCC family thiol-disulfide oxidoreductase YuxK
VEDFLTPVLLFDGECNLCSRAVQFVLKFDRQEQFRFASLQSEAAARLLRPYGQVKVEVDTVVLISRKGMFEKSDAVLAVLDILGGGWRLLLPFRHLPRPWRDWLYDWVARHRYGWFGRRETCLLPTPELRRRFLDS